MMNRNQNTKEKYEYYSLHSDAMDNIQKRTGRLRMLTALLFVLVLLFYTMNRMQKLFLVDYTKQAPDNFTIDRNSTKEAPDRIGALARICTLFSLWMLVFFIAHFIHRICLLVEELCHRKTRYNGSYKKLLIAVFYGSWNKQYFFGSLLVIGIACLRDHYVVLDVCRSYFSTLIVAIQCLLVWFTLKGWSDTEFEHSSSCAPCIGIAMAYGAYYNYYQHVLPKLKERIENSEKEFGINIPVKKLILLFPSSGNINSQLHDGDDSLKCLRDLPDIQKDKGGTLDRKMTNPIYKVSPRNVPPFYCVVEGINCLSTLKGMNLSEDVFRQQAHLLYITLKQILDGSPYKNSYELLCYDDENENERLSNRLWIKYEELLNDIK